MHIYGSKEAKLPCSMKTVDSKLSITDYLEDHITKTRQYGDFCAYWHAAGLRSRDEGRANGYRGRPRDLV